MPARVAGRTTRSSKAVAGARETTIDVPDEGPTTSLRKSIGAIFADAQRSTAAHRKATISLRKVQETCCYEPVSQNRRPKTEEFDETDFTNEIARVVLRILPVKKAESAGDRIVRFLGTYLHTANEKDNEIAQQADPDVTGLPETPTSRLTAHILRTLLPLLQARDKTIRFRTTQIISHIINSLDTLDDQLFHQLRLSLLKRIHDKEPTVRLQAVYGLGRLAAEMQDDDNDDEESDEESGSHVLERLLDVLQNDPSAEVRRNLLLNLPLTKEVLPYLLERARDADATTRRALYARLLPALGDFRHLSLTHREKLLRWGLRDRDENVRKATARLFRERWIEDCAALPAAQAATEDAENGDQPDTAKSNTQAAAPSLDALLELLERIDVVNSGGDGGIALVAMREFWEGRPDYVDYVSFPDAFWEDLSPELAFVARTFNAYCRAGPTGDGQAVPQALDVLVEEKLPEVTKFGFLLEREIQKLIEIAVQAANSEAEDSDEELAQREFIVEQMLHMALTFDYSDEVGRRKMFGLMREALALPDLPEEVTRLVVEVLRLVCGEHAKGEREFCGIVLEAIAEVHDAIMGDDDEDNVTNTSMQSGSVDESFHSAASQPEGSEDPNGTTAFSRRFAGKKGRSVKPLDPRAEADHAIREIMVNMKCLHIALCMLQNVQCDLEENVHLVTMLNNLVVPAVRSQEAPIRERGLLCLGLCCLLGKNLAQENLTLFLHCFAKGHPTLQSIALQIITDILITHPSLLANEAVSTGSAENDKVPSDAMKPILKAYSKSLKSGDATVQSTGATALSKAMLSRLINDADLLKQLVITYFDPDSASNHHLRQSLSYFLPVFCHSRVDNAREMARIAPGIIGKLVVLQEAYLDDADGDAGANEDDGADGDGTAAGGMVSLSRAGAMLLDWTDPRKIVGFAEAAAASHLSSTGVAHIAADVHLLLAEALLTRLVSASSITKAERKVLFSMLAKLHIPAPPASTSSSAISPSPYAASSSSSSAPLPPSADPNLVKSILELLAETTDLALAPDATSRNTLTKLQTSLLKNLHDAMSRERGATDDNTVIPGAETEDVTTITLPLRTAVPSSIKRESLDPTSSSPLPAGPNSRKTLVPLPSETNESVEANDDEEEDLDADDDDEDDDVANQLQRELRDTTLNPTLAFTTTAIVPDAEGTRLDLLDAQQRDEDDDDDDDDEDVEDDDEEDEIDEDTMDIDG